MQNSNLLWEGGSENYKHIVGTTSSLGGPAWPRIHANTWDTARDTRIRQAHRVTFRNRNCAASDTCFDYKHSIASLPEATTEPMHAISVTVTTCAAREPTEVAMSPAPHGSTSLDFATVHAVTLCCWRSNCFIPMVLASTFVVPGGALSFPACSAFHDGRFPFGELPGGAVWVSAAGLGVVSTTPRSSKFGFVSRRARADSAGTCGFHSFPSGTALPCWSCGDSGSRPARLNLALYRAACPYVGGGSLAATSNAPSSCPGSGTGPTWVRPKIVAPSNFLGRQGDY
jgi:hypothetical protein